MKPANRIFPPLIAAAHAAGSQTSDDVAANEAEVNLETPMDLWERDMNGEKVRTNLLYAETDAATHLEAWLTARKKHMC